MDHERERERKKKVRGERRLLESESVSEVMKEEGRKDVK